LQHWHVIRKLVCLNMLDITTLIQSWHLLWNKKLTKESAFLGVYIIRNTNSLQFSVYRKPTILPANSCCPSVHKRVAIRYFVSRLQHYPLGRIEEETQDSRTFWWIIYALLMPVMWCVVNDYSPKRVNKKLESMC
jgi:hypothetical protein